MAISIDHLHKVLQNFVSADEDKRRQSEYALSEHEKNPLLSVRLIEIIVVDGPADSVRLAAAVSLKNQIRKWWKDPEQEQEKMDEVDVNFVNESVEARSARKESLRGFMEEDKERMRDSLFGALLMCGKHPPLRNQVNEAIRLVIKIDYPERWSNVVVQVIQNLKSGDAVRTLCALLVYRSLVQKYEMRALDSRGPLNDLMDNTIELLLQLSIELARNGIQDHERAALLKLSLKAYFSSTQMCLAKGEAVRRSVDGWMTLCESILLSPSTTTEESVQAKKLRKWAIRVAFRFIARYANPTFVYDSSTPEDKEFAQRLLNAWGSRFLQVVLTVLQREPIDALLHNKAALHLYLQYLEECLPHVNTYKVLKPEMSWIVQKVLFPLLCYSSEDEQLIADDPDEYVRRELDISFVVGCPREAAMTFLREVCNLRAKDNLMGILAFCNDILQRNKQELATASAEKSGVLCILGSLSSSICSKKKSLPIEDLIRLHLIPEIRFNGSEGCGNAILRHRVLLCYRDLLYELSRKNAIKDESLHLMAFEAILVATADSSLPVRVAANLALDPFIKSRNFSELVRSHLLLILERLLNVMREIDQEELLEGLEELVDRFQDEIAPYANRIMEHLSTAFVRMQANPDDESAGMTQFQAIKTIRSVLDAVSAVPNKMASVERHMYPVLDYTFTPEGVEYLEEGLSLLVYLTFYNPNISKRLWEYFPQFHVMTCSQFDPLAHGYTYAQGNVGCGWAQDHIEYMLPCIENFITHDIGTFLNSKNQQGRPFKALLMDMAIIVAESKRVLELVNAPRLLCALFEKCAVVSVERNSHLDLCSSGPIDDLVEPALTMSWSLLTEKSWIAFVDNDGGTRQAADAGDVDMIAEEFRAECFSLWGCILAYSPASFMSTLLKMEISSLMTAWLERIPSASGRNVKQRFVFGMTRLMQLIQVATRENAGQPLFDAISNPQMVSHIFPILVGELDNIAKLKQAEDAKNKDTSEKVDTGNDSWSECSDDDNQELTEDQPAIKKSDLLYFKGIAKRVEGADADDEDDSDYVQEQEDSESFMPLEEINIFKLFLSTTQTLQGSTLDQVASFIGGEVERQAFARYLNIQIELEDGRIEKLLYDKKSKLAAVSVQ